MGKIRGIHSSPGIYTKFTDISYAAKTLGVTTLGLVGETLKGPAFEPIPISSWTEFVEYFGGTSPVKFKGSKYPKYELPYIAKEYLSVSDQLYVCRVLGLSGYNAGPAFVITAHGGDGKERAIAVLRSRGTYKKYPMVGDDCEPVGDYDTIKHFVTGVTLSEYVRTVIGPNGCEDDIRTREEGFEINLNNYGRFTIECSGESGFTASYPVSLNVEDKDYIYNVLGSDPLIGSAALYVEELYDVMLADEIGLGNLTNISRTVTTKEPLEIIPVTEPVSDFVTVDFDNLSRKMLGQAYLYNGIGGENPLENGFKFLVTDDNDAVQVDDEGNPTIEPMVPGYIYGVSSYTNPLKSNKKEYVYVQLKKEEAVTSGNTATGNFKSDSSRVVPCKISKIDTDTTPNKVYTVKVLSQNKYYCLDEQNDNVIEAADFSDYKEGFRCAQTPWIVSELKGNGTNVDVLKLFKFYSISDGNKANTEFKVSIANVSPDNGTFDVYIRDFNDTDGSIVVLESYKGLTMKKGDKNYIGYKIGTLNGEYEAKSKYVLVDIVENDMTEECVPCGFLGYPTRNYGDVEQPTFKYNITYDSNLSERKQYFGLSNITGVDVDMLTYKGKYAYTDDYSHGHTDAFHLDSRISKRAKELISGLTITVDEDPSTSGITWQAVASNITNGMEAAIIASDYEMEGSIYESKTMRKFTVCLYGGFDGWDIYRESRTNTDKYRVNKYRGKIENGVGKTFSLIDNPESIALSGNCINTDYYAYLAGAMQFENPEKTLINLFATPGIDYVNQNLLTNDILEMIEDVRGDALYVITTPDKPAGVTDAIDEMYTPREATYNLEETNIDTYYAATYYPWIKYYDRDNLIYLNLPVTKDVLRNMADVDNKKYPWYAPAGIERGNVNCVKARIFSKLEDEDTLYDARINPVKTFSRDGVKIWGNKTLYTGDTPMNRINVVRLMLYMRKLIVEACRGLIFEPNDTTLKGEFEGIVKPILEQIQKDRGITAFRLDVSQTPEQIDAHEMSCVLWVKPTPALEYIEINFMVTPQGVDFDMV